MKYSVGKTYILYDEIELEHEDGRTSYIEPGADVTIVQFDFASMQYTCDEKYHRGFVLCHQDMDRFFVPQCGLCGKSCDPDGYNGACESCNTLLDAKYKADES